MKLGITVSRVTDEHRTSFSNPHTSIRRGCVRSLVTLAFASHTCPSTRSLAYTLILLIRVLCRRISAIYWRDSNTLLDHYWQLTTSDDDIEAFRQRDNLTIVKTTAQDAALMPSWPQALVRYRNYTMASSSTVIAGQEHHSTPYRRYYHPSSSSPGLYHSP
jgi:hypothetical protein